MSKIMEVFSSKEVERKVRMSNQHIRRLIKEDKVDLIKNEDYRVTDEGTYLYTDIAVEKFLAYKDSSPRSKKKESETE